MPRAAYNNQKKKKTTEPGGDIGGDIDIEEEGSSGNNNGTTALMSRLQDKARRIIKVLDHYYPDPPVPLNHTNDFTFLVAVVLSAQTTDGKVNEVTKVLFQHADDPHDMAKLSPSFVQSIIQPVGLAPKKAQYVVGLSKGIVERFGGKVPNTFEDLESLPGVGHKTASVIMSQLFGVSAFAVDTHVHRLALRWGLSKEERNVDKVQADLCKAFPEETWNKAHLQMIYFGREYCTAKNHDSRDCPICSWVNKKQEDMAPPTDFQRFSPSKRAKGLVYYTERIDELRVDPSLAKFSPPPPSSASKTPLSIAVKSETLVETKMDLSAELFDIVDAKEEPSKAIGKGKRKRVEGDSNAVKREIKQEVVVKTEQTTRRSSRFL